ncbi:MAG: hypothetical protein ACREWI_18055, partial [Telluria sp.]
FYGFAGLFSLEVLRLMFGPQWDQSAPLVPLFCMAGSFSVLVGLLPPLMLAAGHSKLVATAELIFQPIRAVGLSLVIYYYRDLPTFATAVAVVAMLQVPLLYTIKQRCLPTDFAALARLIARNLVLTLGTLFPALLVKYYFAPGQALPLMQFLGCVVLTFFAWLLLLWCSGHPLYKEAYILFESRFGRRRSQISPPTAK